MIEDAIRRWNPWWAGAGQEELGRLTGTERETLARIRDTLRLPHVKDLVGVRRAGKTTIMYQLVKVLLGKGAQAKEITFLNFDDYEINAASFEEIMKAIAKIHPDVTHLFVDEVHQKPGWERWLRTLYDSKTFKQIIISGSSASLLSQDIGRVLTGRHLTFAVFPFSFKEVLKFSGWKSFEPDFLERNKNKLLHYQKEYLKNGGFPETAGRSDAEREIVLTNIYNDILARDIAARFNAAYEPLRKLSYHLMSNIGGEFSYRSLSKATGLNFETAEKYLGYLKDSFMILTVDLFSYKTKVQFKQHKKAYCVDTGLRNAVALRFSQDIGKLAENAVLVELKRRGREVYYWKSKSGAEVDFVVKEGLRPTQLIQVCWNIESESTKQRELKGLREAMTELKVREGLILTEDAEKQEQIEGGMAYYIPLWKWLLKHENRKT